MNPIHCPMIHGGLQINLKKSPDKIYVNQCCLRTEMIEVSDNVWTNQYFDTLREKNNSGQWDRACWTCQANENAGTVSLRTGMLQTFGTKTNLSGPVRLDLMFDISCNLACRTCGPNLSTFWQKHLNDHNLPFIAPRAKSRVDDMIDVLRSLDLSNLEMVVFCGGETLLGSGYWKVAEEITKLAPANKITICFQTNGTQTIDSEYFSLIRQFNLVKLHISLDAVGYRFNYLRWPADWQEVVDNIQQLKQNLPVNVMFLIEETVSIFNLYYQKELEYWVKKNFTVNRLGDPVVHTRHMAEGPFGLHNLSREYIMALEPNAQKLIATNFKESPGGIDKMLQEIQKIDNLRNQSWQQVLPEVAEFYSKYL